jgi:hypothetical protein
VTVLNFIFYNAVSYLPEEYSPKFLLAFVGHNGLAVTYKASSCNADCTTPSVTEMVWLVNGIRDGTSHGVPISMAVVRSIT